jgi:hypothetical protein
MLNTWRILMKFTRSRLCASPLPGHRRPLSAREFCRWLIMPIIFGMKGNSYLCSQITGSVENAVPLHVDIPRTGGRGFWFTFWWFSVAIIQISLRMFSFSSSSVRELLLAPMSSNFPSVSNRRLCFVFFFIKSPVVLSLFTKLWIVCLLGTLS